LGQRAGESALNIKIKRFFEVLRRDSALRRESAASNQPKLASFGSLKTRYTSNQPKIGPVRSIQIWETIVHAEEGELRLLQRLNGTEQAEPAIGSPCS